MSRLVRDSAIVLCLAGVFVFVGCGGGGGGDTTTVAAPANFVSSGHTNTSVTLTWVDRAGNEVAYEVQRRQTSPLTVGWATIATLGANVSTYTDAGLNAASTYEYQVRAVGAASASSWAGPVSVTTSGTLTPPSAPTNFRVTAVTSSSVSLAWTDTNAADSLTPFEIQRQASGGSWVALVTTSVGQTTYTDSTAAMGTTYNYQIRATNGTQTTAWVGPVMATPTPVGTVTGRLKSLTTSAAIAGATVTIGTLSATSLSDGSFTLTNVPVGTQTLKATATNYDDLSSAITVVMGANALGDVYMTPAGSGPPPPPF
jgi:hypothetical protein